MAWNYVYKTISDVSDKPTKPISLTGARRSIRVFQLEVYKTGNLSIEQIDKSTKQKVAFVATYQAFWSGRKTGGIDGLKPSFYREDMTRTSALADQVFTWLEQQACARYSQCRMCPIPKKDGTTRMLSVPNISDNAKINCLVTWITPLAERMFQRVWEESNQRFLVTD